MKTLRLSLPSLFSVLAACALSLYLLEATIVLLVCLTVSIIALAVTISRCISAKKARWRIVLLTMIPAILFVTIAGSHLFLRLIFKMYRGRFDRVAAQIEAGTVPETPFRIGPFKIEMAGQRDESGAPYLATNKEPWEINGFVKHPDGHGFNLWSCVTLDESWSYIAED